VQNKSRKPGVLRRREDFLVLKAKGRRVRPANWLLMNYKANQLDFARCGWTIPKKVGNAVLRNKLKRWCRECVRSLQQDYLQRGIDLNVVINGADGDFFKTIKFQDFKSVFERGLQNISKT
jgi:ribonuclease P protein component